MNSLTLLDELESILRSNGYEDDSDVLSSLDAIRGLVLPLSTYTSQRASALVQVSDMLHSLLEVGDMSYPNKAYTISVVSQSYLKLVHAFKTDSSLWGDAQSNLVPVLMAASTEDDIDSSIALLVTHLTRYRESLSSWLSRP